MTAGMIRRALTVLLLAFLVAAPWLLPLVVAPFWVTVLSEIMIWSLLAASVNLLFGYTGLLSFGQALYFGFGMYGVAISIAKFGFGFWPAFGTGVALAVLMALIAGVFAVRLTWHYFAIITVVFSLIFYFAALSAKPITGGDDGTSFSLPPMFTWGGVEYGLVDETFQYFFILAAVVACYGLKALLIRSSLGRFLLAVRENDRRAELVGLDVFRIRLTAFVCAGFLAGVAGALFAFYGRYASASYMFYHVSGEAVVWALVGGSGTLLGPAFGTALLIVVREELSTVWEHYLLLVGAIVIAVVIFAPRGIAGWWNAALDRLDGTAPSPSPAAKEPIAVARAEAERG